jgi:1,4-alpha-glucan branching enzyme
MSKRATSTRTGDKTEPDKRTSRLSEYDLHLFNEGSHFKLYEHMGAHPMRVGGDDGTHFAVWAPDAESVHVFGDFNGWDRDRHPLAAQGHSGVWAGFVPGVGHGTIYKYHIRSRIRPGYSVDKADPFAFHAETPPKTGSIIWDIGDYQWNDDVWMARRGERQRLNAPFSIYECHLGSWMRNPEQGNRSLSYQEVAPRLVDYLTRLGFTHVEFLPLTEHPFYGSWGYQTTGFFAPTSRYGTPQDFMHLVDALHQAGIGVILDWVPSHFPSDEHGLAYFDGSHLFEHSDPRQGYHPDWNSYIFNYGRNEVRSFLTSSGLYWLDKYHIDGLRVDAVASMLYLDYSRKEGEWIPNEHGGRENLEAIGFLRRFNEAVYEHFPDVQTIAEESTAWPAVSRPTYLGGLGFGLKWDMGWMHDTLEYFKRDPIYRQHHHNEITFRAVYAFHENFVMPLSHDEVVHGKGSLINRMPGDDWQKFANLRLLYSYMWAQAGKKLLFMGGEIAQWDEWSHEGSLDWHLAEFEPHAGIQRTLGDLNALYRTETALHDLDTSHEGTHWLEMNDYVDSCLAFLRRDRDDNRILCAFNFTPVPRHNYRLGVPKRGRWREIFNSDAPVYGGSGVGNYGGADTTPVGSHGFYQSLSLTLPPLAAVYFKHEQD